MTILMITSIRVLMVIVIRIISISGIATCTMCIISDRTVLTHVLMNVVHISVRVMFVIVLMLNVSMMHTIRVVGIMGIVSIIRITSMTASTIHT